MYTFWLVDRCILEQAVLLGLRVGSHVFLSHVFVEQALGLGGDVGMLQLFGQRYLLELQRVHCTLASSGQGRSGKDKPRLHLEM